MLDRRPLEAMDAWGKHLFYFFEGRRVLHVHLGMDGRFRRQRLADGDPRPARRSTWLRLSSPELSVDLDTPKVCELIDVVHQRSIVGRLGPDPLRGGDGSGVAALLPSRQDPIGVALLDQSLVAGIGNVYRAEILYACRMHPERPACSVGADEWARIWATAADMLEAGVRDRGQIRTVDRRDTKVRDRRRVYVYGQRMCAHCGSPIRVWDLAGRTAYACETCQPRWEAGPPEGRGR